MIMMRIPPLTAVFEPLLGARETPPCVSRRKTIEPGCTAEVVTVQVTDDGPGVPAARGDGSGELATVVDALASLWDVVYSGASKTVTASIPVRESPLPALIQDSQRGAR
jgi:hypothetical protein